jgi:hypothetical protein
VPLLSAAGDCWLVEPDALMPLSTLTAGACTIVLLGALPAFASGDCAIANPPFSNTNVIVAASKNRLIISNPYAQKNS